MIYRKVFTKDRTPNIQDGEWIDTSLGDIKFFSNHITNGIWKYNIHTIEWWLEEVSLSTDERFDKLKLLIQTGKLQREAMIGVEVGTPQYHYLNGEQQVYCNLCWEINNIEQAVAV